MPTMRQMLEVHRTAPTCAACHSIFEPVGLALENFDAVGAWRTLEEGMPSRRRRRAGRRHEAQWRGQPAQLAGAVSDQFARVVTEKLLTYALGRGVEDGDMPLVRSIVQDAEASKYPVLVARVGHRQEPCVPDEYEAGGNPPSSAHRVNERDASCLLQRSTFHGARFCAAPAPRWRCRSSTRWCRRATLLAQTAAAPKPRFVGLFVPHGWPPGYWVPEKVGALPEELPFNWKSLEPFRDKTVILSGLHSRSAEPPPGVTGADHWVAAAFMCADKPKKTAGADVHAGTTIDQLIAQKIGAETPDPVAADGGRRPGRELEQLRRGLQLRLHQHDLVGDADLAAADGAQPAGGVRAHVRRRHDGRSSAPRAASATRAFWIR